MKLKLRQLIDDHVRYGIDSDFGIDCTIQTKPVFTLWLRFLCCYLTIF